ncbi:SMI1/KNR4 family protein, partial [Listeria welshimeri]|nr:SMI1/KNR4 family protein [Listeria welshimeri]
MSYEYLINNNKNVFYPVSLDEIKEVEKELAVNIPEELKNFFINVGYGFIKGSKYNINRIMDPYSIRDF